MSTEICRCKYITMIIVKIRYFSSLDYKTLNKKVRVSLAGLHL